MTMTGALETLRKRWWVVLTAVVVVAGGFIAASLNAVPMYQTSASLFFSATASSSGTDLNQGANYTQSQMLSFAELATMPIVLDDVVDDLDLDMSVKALARTITASTAKDSVILSITAVSSDPQQAADVANAVAQRLTEVVATLSPESEAGQPRITATVVADAVPPLAQFAPNTRRNAITGAAIGAIVGVLAALLWAALDTRVRRETEADAASGSTVVGRIRLSRKGPVILDTETTGALAEDVRRLRTNLHFLAVKGEALRILVTSAVAGEGKSTVAVNLAVALAGAGDRVLLIDGDLRKPTVAKYLGLEGGAGLTELLIGEVELEEVIQPVYEGLDVIASGSQPPNPSDLVSRHTLAELVDALEEQYDVILLDSPPVLPVADAVTMSRVSQGALIVVDTTRTSRTQLRHAAEGLRTGGASVMGVVLNKVRTGHASSYGYGTDER
ncbi:polysaccharide biosynthesis tyrosine autokinase [Miniimonas sp. S16]|uniref:polysaccharide biosynthesis tyrosine autokinase n=1 Tax=Miniimonas sp. S16 TaxID=2171623 RepID=UPI000D5265D3|nr:polysaccharide biosynthesis tyrosine autokinase [Miniimonas sp. S16]